MPRKGRAVSADKVEAVDPDLEALISSAESESVIDDSVVDADDVQDLDESELEVPEAEEASSQDEEAEVEPEIAAPSAVDSSATMLQLLASQGTKEGDGRSVQQLSELSGQPADVLMPMIVALEAEDLAAHYYRQGSNRYYLTALGYDKVG